MAIRFHQYLLLLATVLTVPFSAQANTGQYTVTILGRVQHNYPDSTFVAACVNDNDVVAGSANVRVPHNFTRPTRGVIWNSSTHYTILGTISEDNGFDSEASWINNSGIAVGSSIENTSHGFVTVPVVFTPTGIVDLGIKNALNGNAVCINNNGQIVGNLDFNGTPISAEAFLYQNGVMTLLGYPVPTIGYSQATAINKNGLIVGAAIFTANEQAHPACYTNGAWVDLASGFNGAGEATSVTDSGTIVGTWGAVYFIYQNGQFAKLNAPRSGLAGPPSINNAGQIVVGNFIYQNGVWQDINNLDLGDGWTFLEAFGINNQGAIIGVMSSQGGNLERYALLTPVTSNKQPASSLP
jgi:probable HAF family extracellular repeat protein